MLFCTTCTASHFARAQVLVQSVRKQYPGAIIVLCLCEARLDPRLAQASQFDAILLARDLGYECFEQFVFRYTATEACCALKARLLSYLRSEYPTETAFVYLDADIQLFGPLIGLTETLQTMPLVLTPHHTTPVSGLLEAHLLLSAALMTGTYNAGFVAVNHTAEADQFLQWWDALLQALCVKEQNWGFFLDQGWLDLIPGMVPTHIEKDPTWNTAVWNILHRELTCEEGQDCYYIDGKSLTFFHFSQLDKAAGLRPFLSAARYATLERLIRTYQIALAEQESRFPTDLPWSYASFRSGEPITEWSRTLYRKAPRYLTESSPLDPFELSNRHFLPAERFGAPV